MRLAQESITNPAISGSLQGKSGLGFFQSALPAFVGLGFVIGALMFFFVMLAGAISWITSGGDKVALEAARSRVTNAVVGFVVLVVLFALLKVVEDFFGINILSLDIGPLKIQ